PGGRRGAPASPEQQPPGRPPRSPIFEAMQSEWFQRGAEPAADADPIKGWASPGDDGFQAVEALREPVKGKQTTAGLPKRVPGRNRVPGAVGGARSGANGAQQAAGGTNGAAQAPGQQQGQAQARQPAVPPDAVRNRFASLQRGVARGRTETRGTASDLPGGGSADSGTNGEDPSRRSGGETGGTR
ncbi:hypothetical protein EBO15_42615, partial [Actinomadura harenae]